MINFDAGYDSGPLRVFKPVDEGLDGLPRVEHQRNYDEDATLYNSTSGSSPKKNVATQSTFAAELQSVKRSPWKTFPKKPIGPSSKDYIDNLDWLKRGNEFWDDIAAFRQEFARDFVSTIPPRNVELKEETGHGATVAEAKVAESVAPNDRKVQSGFYTVNERLFPSRTRNPFLFVFNDRDINAVPAPPRSINDEDPPVKVSIPSNVQPRLPSSPHYKPHRRKSFDPQNSNLIQSYLHSAYVPLGPRNIAPQLRPKNLSLKSEAVIKAKN